MLIALLEDRTISEIDPVGGEFQPRLETGYPGGGAHLVRLCQLSPLSQLGQFCQLKDIIDFNVYTLMALKPPLVPGSGF
jgi:hypothetical protein